MKRMNEVLCNQHIIIESNLPIKTLLKFDITNEINNHGKLNLTFIVIPDKHADFLIYYEQEIGKPIYIKDTNQQPNPWLFMGRIQAINVQIKSGILTAEIKAATCSIDLDQSRIAQGFQQSEVTFYDVAMSIVAKYKEDGMLWYLPEQERKTKQPFIQYEESDWEFLKRLASHFNAPIYTTLYSHDVHVNLGIQKRLAREFNEANIVEFGVSDKFYQQDGSSEQRQRSEYTFLLLKHRESWEIGDVIRFENQRLTLTKHHTTYDEKGEVLFYDTFEASGSLHFPTIYNENLLGVEFDGTVVGVQNHHVQVRFGFDQMESTHWWNWTPEVNNFAYIMPELNTRVVLKMNTQNELDGLVTHVRRNGGRYPSHAHQGFSTQYDKLLALHPDQIMMRGKGNLVGITMSDEKGVKIRVKAGISINAEDDIVISGSKVFIKAPDQILLQTTQSNLEMCKNFNLYAPSGIINTGTGNTGADNPTGQEDEAKTQENVERKKERKPVNLNHLQVSFSALNAVPSVSSSQISADNVMKQKVVGIVPSFSGGHFVMTMSEIMDGIPIEKTTFPEAVNALGIYTTNGGYQLPKVEEKGR